MAWIALLLAGLLEVLWAMWMKESHGFTKPRESLAMLAAMLASFGLLAFAMRTLPLGTAYAIWTGIGALGAFVVGLVAYGEPVTPLRCVAAALLLSGIALLKLSSA